ncbi:MAG: hypothetical protein ORO03_07510, partial [Alphaproteobacteria bacterium]|nr:hypothetical protein [Alphaproteobacteria bacterium]
LRLDLGKLGALTSSGAGSPNYTLDASGLDVYFTGNTSAHSATIAVGGGSFTFVNDKRDTTTETVLGNTTIASVGGLGNFTLSGGSGTLGGLTVTTSGTASTINKQGVVYGGVVTINGVTTGNAKDFTYIEGTKIQVWTTASTFSGALALVANGSDGIEFDVNLTASGKVSILAPKFTMSGNVTIQPTTSLLINLGGGEFVNGTGNGYTLATNNKDLTFIAGSVSNTNATNAVFSLGSGTLNLKGGLGLAVGGSGSSTTLYEGDYINASNDLAEASVTSYYFTSLEGADLAAAKTRVNDSAARWLSAAALTAPGGALGTKYTGTGLAKYTSAGFSGSTGQILWKNAGTVT